MKSVSHQKFSAFQMYLVDSFTVKHFHGNPAAVCLLFDAPSLKEWRSQNHPKRGNRGTLPEAPSPSSSFLSSDDGAFQNATLLQQIAFELGYSETVFLYPYAVKINPTSKKSVQHNDNDDGLVSTAGVITPTFHIRWFTPLKEVGLCGHATLAAAHILFSLFSSSNANNNVQMEEEATTTTTSSAVTEIKFLNPLSGVLSVASVGHDSSYQLNFPLRMPRQVEIIYTNTEIPASETSCSKAAPSPRLTQEEFLILLKGLGLTSSFSSSEKQKTKQQHQKNFLLRPELLVHEGSRKYLLVLSKTRVVRRRGGHHSKRRSNAEEEHQKIKNNNAQPKEVQEMEGENNQKECDDGVDLLLSLQPDFQFLLSHFHPQFCVAPLSVTVTTISAQEEEVGKISSSTSNMDQIGNNESMSTIPYHSDTMSVNHGVDVVSRHFAPWVGIPEDPVTGAAHVVLAPYWSKQLGKLELTCCQASRRGGIIQSKIASDPEKDSRIQLTGSAVTVLQGTISLPSLCDSKL